MQIKTIQNKRGFTLIEIMIATAIFVVVCIMGIGVLLNVSKSHKITEILRSGSDNLSFVLEDMARNLRLGSSFHCGLTTDLNPQDAVSCPLAGTALASSGQLDSLGIVFEGLYGSIDTPDDQIAYQFVPDSIGSPTGYIEKSIDGGSTFKRITSPDIKMTLSKSGFSVIGSQVDQLHTRIILRLVGTVTHQNISMPFDFQTSISPRTSDS